MTRPTPTAHEPAWSQWLAAQWAGVAEARMAEGSRADVLTDDAVWEVEWAKKWKESIGQALLYEMLAGVPGGVCLLTRGKPSEPLYIMRCAAVCRRTGLLFRTVPTQ